MSKQTPPSSPGLISYLEYLNGETVRREPLLTIKELADQLGRSTVYVWAMKRCGFRMPGGTATLSEARRWLEENPEPFKILKDNRSVR